MKRILFAFFLLLSMKLCWAQSGGRVSPKDRANELKLTLSLTDIQADKIRAVYETQVKRLDSMMNANSDRSAMRSSTVQDETYARLIAVLTPEQANKLRGMQRIRKQFPFPPPKGYASEVLPDEPFKNCKNLEDVNRIITLAIDKTG